MHYIFDAYVRNLWTVSNTNVQEKMFNIMLNLKIEGAKYKKYC